MCVQKQVESMVYLSSMEVYGDIDCNDGRYVSEKELGNIDIDSSRSCYPLGKRMAEHYCHIFHKEYHVPVKIARLSQAFGLASVPPTPKYSASPVLCCPPLLLAYTTSL